MIFICLFFLIGINNLFAQVTTANEIREELNELWDKYVAFQIPNENKSNYSDGLKRFNDRFWGILDGSGDENLQMYYFAGISKDMFVFFLGSNDGITEYLIEQRPKEYFLTDDKNRNILRSFIKRWQEANGIEGNFF
jgi:hypothetical protein